MNEKLQLAITFANLLISLSTKAGKVIAAIQESGDDDLTPEQVREALSYAREERDKLDQAIADAEALLPVE